MKLNLLPTYVSKGNQAKTATVVSVLLALIGVLGAVGMIIVSKDQLKTSREDAQSKMQRAVDAVARSKEADQIVTDAQMIIRNINLADAMRKHSDVYPDFYRDMKPYIPAFFRVTQMQATPIDAANCQLTLTGTVKTFQQYADLMIALYRIPGATSVSRSGYNNEDYYIPNVTDVDQNGRPIKPGQGNVPDNKYDRLAYYQGQVGPTGFTGAASNYGTGDDTQPKLNMPGYSLVTVTVVVPRPLQTPDPRATLSTQGSATPGGGGTAPAGGPPLGGPGGPPGGGGRGPAQGD